VRARLLVSAGLAVALAGGCKEKARERRAAVPVAALAAIPADASVVVGIDVPQLAQAAVVARAVDQMLIRDPELAARLGRLAKDCGVDVTTQVKTVLLAVGPRPEKTVGPQSSLLVASGQIGEAALTRCLQAGTGGGGGQLSVRDSGGRPLYKLTEGTRVLHFAFGRDDTVVIGGDEKWVLAAVGDGPKVETSKALGPLLEQVDRGAAVWAVATMDVDLGAGLAKITKGKLTTPPQALHGSLATKEGLAGEVAFRMQSEGDAEALVGFARSELDMLTMAAQGMGLGPLVAKVKVERKGAEARFRVALNDAEVKQVLSAIDRGGGSGQDAQPAPDGGTSPTPPTDGPP
jgi:hypothetical protein